MTINDVIRHNKDAGKFFFSPATMAFFNCEIESHLIDDTYFVTSERFDPDGDKLFTIREYNYTDGSIGTIGEFQEYDRLEDALLYINQLVMEGE